MPGYGNYCGPNWSDGKSQPSVAYGSSTPINDNDRYCQIHDTAYATPQSRLDEADMQFSRKQFSTGTPAGFIMGAAVGAQGMLRQAGILPKKNKIMVVARRKSRISRYMGKRYKGRRPKQPIKRNRVKVTIKKPSQRSVPFTGSVRRGPRKYYKSKHSRKSNRGIQLEQEVTGRVTDSNAVYVGIGSFPHDQITDLICLQLVKALYMKKDTQVHELLNNIEIPVTIELTTFDNTAVGIPQVNLTDTFTELTTYQQLALGGGGNEGLKDVLLEIALARPNSRFSEIKLNETIAGNTRSVSIQLTGHSFNIKTYQQLAIQNVTTASGLVPNATETTNTTNNPLSGKIYRSKYGTGMEYRPLNSTSPYYFGAGRLYGDIAAKGTTLALSELPLSQHMYPKNAHANVVISPGSIMRFKQSSREYITLEGHSRLVNFAGTAAKTITNRGKSMVVGLEPIVRQFADQSAIVVDYEVESKYYTSMRYRNDYMTGKINRTVNLGELA